MTAISNELVGVFQIRCERCRWRLIKAGTWIHVCSEARGHWDLMSPLLHSRWDKIAHIPQVVQVCSAKTVCILIVREMPHSFSHSVTADVVLDLSQLTWHSRWNVSCFISHTWMTIWRRRPLKNQLTRLETNLSFFSFVRTLSIRTRNGAWWVSVWLVAPWLVCVELNYCRRKSEVESKHLSSQGRALVPLSPFNQETLSSSGKTYMLISPSAACLQVLVYV